MFLIYFRNTASHGKYVYDIPHIMSLSMHDINYSLYEMMRIICDPIYTMNSTWVNTCINMGNARDSHSELVILK